jgi:hypothetical protein
VKCMETSYACADEILTVILNNYKHGDCANTAVICDKFDVGIYNLQLSTKLPTYNNNNNKWK